MSVFVVPSLEEEEWPTLGPQICDFLEERAIFGPGDLRGEPAVIDDETRALFYRAYQVFPQGHERAGRRRFRRVGWSLRKGSAKTEKASWAAYVELHQEGPVRCDGFDAYGQPVGIPVRDPYIPMVAFNAEQVEELAYGALRVICQEGPDADLFDAGYERIRRSNGEGKAEAMASSPNSADGARTTFQHFDETHRMILPRLVRAHQTMQNNLPKRVKADAWGLETTTTFAEGDRSVAEATHKYAESIAKGKIKNRSLFFFHRSATQPPGEDLTDFEQRKTAIRSASGPALAKWESFEDQVEAIATLYDQPDTDRDYWEQVWLNRNVSRNSQAFDVAQWRQLAQPEFLVPPGDPVVIGFDGARWRDACCFVGTHIATGHQWPIALWQKPPDLKPGDWEVTDDQVNGALADAMTRWRVHAVYCDPPRFEDNIAKWSGKYGPKRVVEWYTHRQTQVGQAMRAYKTAIDTGQLSHNGDSDFNAHIANARKGNIKSMDDDGTPLWTIYKERPDSENYIDLAMAGCLSWQARIDTLARGRWERRSGKTIVRRG